MKEGRMQECKESAMDRVARALAGVALVGLGFFSSTSWLRVVLMGLGAILVVTGVAGYCFIRALFGLQTVAGGLSREEASSPV